MTTEVVMIGGGIVGAAAAYQLACADISVTLVDAEHDGKATAAGAGIISPASSISPPDVYYPLAYAAAAHYPALLAQLADDGEPDTGYEVVGGLFLAATEDEALRLDIVERLLWERRLAGAPNLGDLERLTGVQAKALFPAIGDLTSAIYMPEAARLNGRLLCDALTNAAVRRGASRLHGQARVCTSGGKVVGVQVASETIAADVVVVCGGAWSNAVAGDVGVDLPVVPQKGQILHLEMPQSTGNWPILVGFHSHYMLTFPSHRVVVGATRETGSGYDTRMTAAGMQEILHEALRIAPGLGGAEIVDMRVGLRPTSPDGLPILGSIPGIEGLFVATGHGASGLTLGAYSGMQVANLAVGQEVHVDLQPFSVNRFA
ncbi:oxidoreductase [Alicyclobacillus acidoterrestris]|uniref:NAD(P)/FAD-dependent oxidoreductase n=1 Tax=Alicyclobacillus suci TaxID=2816080 RepID=UPI00118FB040|nr:FAD-binding oxidoreductase [Alicyclobacillus suci]GEO25668.1 oxidoreductase [Alicyclobacillus acidoterrestris]